MTPGLHASDPKRKALRHEALRFVAVALVASVTMAALKIGVGWFSGSHALMVNAVYSINDVFSTIAVAVSLRIGYRRANSRYPYGYGKAEFIAVGLVSITIALFVCLLVLYSVVSIVSGREGPPHYVAAPLALLSLAKAIVVVDEWVDIHNPTEAAWQALGNVDWSRDVVIGDGPVDQLDHASYQSSFGGKIGLDATAKLPEEGYGRGWPEVARMDPEVKARVDAAWSELGT